MQTLMNVCQALTCVVTPVSTPMDRIHVAVALAFSSIGMDSSVMVSAVTEESCLTV